eukprot:Hpha_TRINITY_DN4477_c0_g1::TRINITY_DN4477_c0_g1_i1::g.50516::m.50516
MLCVHVASTRGSPARGPHPHTLTQPLLAVEAGAVSGFCVGVWLQRLKTGARRVGLVEETIKCGSVNDACGGLVEVSSWDSFWRASLCGYGGDQGGTRGRRGWRGGDEKN